VIDSERIPINVAAEWFHQSAVDLVERIAGVRLTAPTTTAAPKGVAGRNSDNALVRQC